MEIPPDVVALLDGLTNGIREAQGENLTGVYLRGSLAMEIRPVRIHCAGERAR